MSQRTPINHIDVIYWDNHPRVMIQRGKRRNKSYSPGVASLSRLASAIRQDLSMLTLPFTAGWAASRKADSTTIVKDIKNNGGNYGR